jgi:hypothetical protein
MSTEPPSSSLPGVGVDRLLEAVSRPLSLQLEAMLAEQRQRLEAEANVRLRKALLDQEAELAKKSGAEQDRARAETTEEVRRQVSREMESQFEGKLAAELRALKDRLDRSAREAAEGWEREREELAQQAERWHVLTEFYRRTGTVVSQSEILSRFMKAAVHFAGGVALYLEKDGGLARWGREGGAAAFPEIVSEETRDPDWYWAPVRVRSRTVVVVGATSVGQKDALDVLTGALRRAIENLGLRLGAGLRGEETEAESPNGGSETASRTRVEPEV